MLNHVWVLLSPPSYKWWLLTYGGGEVYGDEIYSLYGPVVDVEYSGDIVYQYESNVENGLLSRDQVAIFNMDGVDYYFDISQPSPDLEYPVYTTQNNNVKYADNFLEFLEKQIKTTEI